MPDTETRGYSDQSCSHSGCDEPGTIRLLNNHHGTHRFCLSHAAAINALNWAPLWRDAFGDLHRAREYERDEMMLRESWR